MNAMVCDAKNGFASAVDKWVFEGITAPAKGVIMMKTRIVHSEQFSPEGYEKGRVLCKHKYTVTSKPTFDTMAIKNTLLQYNMRVE